MEYHDQICGYVQQMRHLGYSQGAIGEIVAHYKGHLGLDPYKKVSAIGVFRTTTIEGGNTFHNQLELYSAIQTSE